MIVGLGCLRFTKYDSPDTVTEEIVLRSFLTKKSIIIILEMFQNRTNKLISQCTKSKQRRSDSGEGVGLSSTGKTKR